MRGIDNPLGGFWWVDFSWVDFGLGGFSDGWISGVSRYLAQ